MCPGGAGCGLTCRFGLVAMAGYGLAWPGSWGRWLPVWLPGIVSDADVRMSGTRCGHRIARYPRVQGPAVRKRL